MTFYGSTPRHEEISDPILLTGLRPQAPVMVPNN